MKQEREEREEREKKGNKKGIFFRGQASNERHEAFLREATALHEKQRNAEA